MRQPEFQAFISAASSLKKKKIFFMAVKRGKTLSSLHPLECRHVHGVCDSRKTDFATGRWCCRELLKKMGYSGKKRIALPVGTGGEPLWPDGFCGSISHASGIWCSASARTTDFASIGVDVEVAKRDISDHALERIFDRKEMGYLRGLRKVIPAYQLGFSIKESIFKAFYPMMRRRFGFDAVSVASFGPGNAFSAVLRRKLCDGYGRGAVVHGMYFISSDYVLTLVALPATGKA